MAKIYHKLVRDLIPDIIKEDGKTPVTRVLNDEEYKVALEKKLYEEYQEVLNASGLERIEELADMYEVIASLANLEGCSIKDIEEAAKNKHIKRGGFEKKIFLESVEE